MMLYLAQCMQVTLIATLDPSYEGFKDAHGGIYVGITYPDLCNAVKPGDTVVLADGTLRLKVESIINHESLLATVSV